METTAPAPCKFCSAPSVFNTNHWTGSDDYATACTQEWEPRIDVCRECTHLVRDFPRKPRTPRKAKAAAPALYGDYAQLAAFVGIRTDGSGRRA